jgi:hypothetical protein
VKDPYSNYPQFISVAGQQLDIRSVTDLLKKSKYFPQQNAHAKGFFVNYRI